MGLSEQVAALQALRESGAGVEAQLAALVAVVVALAAQQEPPRDLVAEEEIVERRGRPPGAKTGGRGPRR